jgi:crotonobetaine/carnitine-CoA ligase
MGDVMTHASTEQDRESFVLDAMLRRQARLQPDKVFARFEDGTCWTYAQTLDEARRVAASLQRLGVGLGDPVLCWLPNGPELLRTWFGINLRGAVYVPVNTAYRGSLLERVVCDSEARVLVAHHALLERLNGIDNGALADVVVVGERPGDLPVRPDLRALDEATALLAADGRDWPGPERPLEPWDLQAIMYTSGTTGPSKGVLVSYRQHSSACGVVPAEPDDKYLINSPLFHGGATLPVISMLKVGGSVAIVRGFSTTDFWPVIETTGVNSCTLMGPMAPFLVRADGPERGRHGLRRVCIAPFNKDGIAFAERFGVEVYTAYNSTEMSTPLVAHPGFAAVPGICGRPRPGVEVRIVDEFDRELPDGEAGELIVRTDQPWTMTSGYHRMPEATVAAWRNGWFHTGDAFRRTADGDYVFVDRLKDAIRRRGENVSSVEVEAEALTHPAVARAGAVGVPSEYAEEEILLAVEPAAGARIDPRQLVEHLTGRLPYFMVPRYIRVVDELAMTPSGKVRKDVLRQQGTTGAWDREAAGMVLKRERLS